jgi:tellurite resistance protein
MLRKRKKQARPSQAPPAKLDGKVLAGIVEAGFLIAAYDGTVRDEKLEEIATVIRAFTNESASDDDIMGLLNACAMGLDRDGYDARIDVMVRHLPSDALRRYALNCAATVIACDDDFSDLREGEMFMAMAEAIGFSRDEAFDLLEETRRAYE